MLQALFTFILFVLILLGTPSGVQSATALEMAPQKLSMEALPFPSLGEKEEREHWLAFNALYEMLEHHRVTGYNQLYCQTCRDEDMIHRRGMATSWSITDRDSALGRINRFFEPNRYPSYEQTFQAFREAGAAADKDIANKIDIAETALAKHLGLGVADFQRVDTVLAWDFMRCANMVKECYNLGYITEEEAWVYLRENAAMAEAVFDTWQDYFVSFMLGRVISYQTAGTDDYVLAAFKLFQDPNCEWFYGAIKP